MPEATSRAPSARRAWSIQPDTPGLARVRSLAARVWSDHRLFVLVLAPAVLLRVDAELGYRWQSWFNDSFVYLAHTISFSLDPTRVSGYSLWLRILEPLHSYALITILQHLEGLAVGVMVYALARHRFGAKAWIATLAAVPVLYDGFEVQLEHLIMADTPFLFVVMLATTLLLWNPAGPSTRVYAVIGLLLGLAAVLRSIGLPLVAIFGVYLIIRRIGWRKVAATLVVSFVPVFAYAGVFYLEHGQFAMSNSTGVFLYSRVMTFADCSVIHPPAAELELCTTVAPDKRGIDQAYIWTSTRDTPLDRFPSPVFNPVTNQFGEDFAIRAIEAQPLGYLKAVVHDTVMAFGWKRIVFPQAATYNEYLFGKHSLPIPSWDRVNLGKYHTYASFYVRGNPLTDVVDPYATVIRVYQQYVWLPGTIYGFILIAGFGGIVLAWRRLGGEALLPWTISFAMILIPAATAEFDYRYVLPAVPFACLAAVMAFSRGTAGHDALQQLTGLGQAEGAVRVSGVAGAPPASAVDSGDDERDLAADGA